MARPDRGGLLHFSPPSAMVARACGVACIAVGFVLGIEGLSSPESAWLRSSLALIVTGLLAQVYAMYATIRHRRALEGHREEAAQEEGRQDGPHDRDSG